MSSSNGTGNLECSASAGTTSPAGWVYQLYKLRDEIAALSTRDEANGRSVFALWGPSQVGKSTLLSTYLDHGADSRGNGSALQWDPAVSVRFEREDAKSTGLTLNPYNFHSDASACITRFRLAESVPDAKHPVELRMATDLQLVHSLALGFIADWKSEGRTQWTDQILEESLRELGPRGQSPTRESFKSAVEIATLVDLLSDSRLTGNPFGELSKRAGALVLDSAASRASPERLDELKADLFWPKAPSINNLYHELKIYRKQLFGGSSSNRKPLFCSYEVASLILDMAAFVNAVGGHDLAGAEVKSSEDIKDQLLSIKIQRRADSIALDLEQGEALIQDARQFALLQALVWELVIPVKSSRLDELGKPGQALKDLLSVSDILDFPGVSNIGVGGDDTLDEKTTEKAGDHLFFSHLLKRGKTSAMVAATASADTVDGFCVLLRTLSGIARPGVIVDGIKTWWQFTTKTELTATGSRLAPLNVCFTFFAEFLTDVLRNPNRTIGPAFDKFKSLGPLLSQVVSSFFPICFPKYENPDEDIEDTDLDAAVDRIVEDPQAKVFFPDKVVINNAANNNDGGTGFLIKSLTTQASTIARTNLLGQRVARAAGHS